MGTKKRRKSLRIKSKSLHDSSSDPEFQKTMSVIDKLSKKYQEKSPYDADIENTGDSTSSSQTSTFQTSTSSNLYDFNDDFMDSPFLGNVMKTYIKPIKTKVQMSHKKKVQEGKKKFAGTALQKRHVKKEQKMNANFKKTGNLSKKDVVKRIKSSSQQVSTPMTQSFKAAAVKSALKKSQVLSPIENSKTPVGNGGENKSVSFSFKSPEIQPVRRKGRQPLNIETNVQILRSCDRKGSKIGTPAFKRKKDLQDDNTRETRSAKKKRLVQDDTQSQSSALFYKSSEVNSDHCDSGVFVSPILTKLKALKKHTPKLPLSKLDAKETSTPIVKPVANKHSRPSDSCFSFKPTDFSSVLMPSPVPRVETTLSDYSSMAVEESMFSQEEAEKPSTSAEVVVKGQPKPVFSLSSTSEDEAIIMNRSCKSYKRNQKKIRVGRYSLSKVEAWADKINSQFEEIDKYELSIEG